MGCDGNEPETRRYYLALASELPDGARVLWVGTPPPDDFTAAAHTAGIAMCCVAADAPLPDAPAERFDRVVVNLVDDGRLGDAVAVARGGLRADGRLVVGIFHAGSLRHVVAALAAGTETGPPASGATLSSVIATLAGHGFLVEQVRPIREGDADPAPACADLVAALRPAPDVDYQVVAARPTSVAAARRAAGDLATALADAGRRDAVDVPAYDALARQERQLANFDRSLGWRLLARYGPYKHRLVLPAWQALKDRVQAWRGSERERTNEYDRWARFAEAFHGGVLEPIAPVAGEADRLVSVVVPVDTTQVKDLAILIASLSAQSYATWELRVAWVAGADPASARPASDPASSDPRVVHVDVPATTRTEAANEALAGVRGEIIVLLPFPVELAPDALAAFVRAFAATDGDVVYGDEDVRDAGGGRRDPDFKPAWSPDLLLSRMYWPHAVAYRASFLRAIGLLREELAGAAHYDLALRATELPGRIVHVPRVLSHAAAPWGPTGDLPGIGAIDAGRRALEAAVVRRGLSADVVAFGEDGYRVRRTVTRPGPVTIIVPTRDNVAMLRRCIASLEATDHPRFEIAIVDNGSADRPTLEYLAATPHRVIRAPGPFNFARLNNQAMTETASEYAVFLNDDTEATERGWLRALEEHAQRPEVGAVGAKLVYPNGRIQHAGIALGIGGLAGHPFRFRPTAPPGVRNVSAVTAACLMMRRATFEQVGRFDERLPVNSNDVDLCLRLRDRGYLVVYTPYATLVHRESATRGLRATPDDAWLMTRRWRALLRADPYYNPNAELAIESGEMDLSKPDGLVRIYDGPPGTATPLRVAPAARVGQSCYVAADDLAAIVLRGIVIDGDATSAVRLVLQCAPDGAPVRVVDRSFPGRVPHERWFCFEPVAASGGRRWHFTLEGRDGRSFVVSRTTVVSDVTGPCFENGAPTYGTIVFELYARAPYRCAMSAA